MRTTTLARLQRCNAIAMASVACFMLTTTFAFAAGNMDATDKYAWSENGGWVNFGPTHGGVTVHIDGYLSGYAWLESIGWIKLGNGSPGPYANTSADDWGVNMGSDRKLSGYAWSENAGWINFHPAHGRVTISLADGRFDGYAWSESVGWIHFQSPLASNVPEWYAVRTTARLLAGSVLLVR